MAYIASAFPFTMEEITQVFRADVATDELARFAAEEFAQSWRAADGDDDEGWICYPPLSTLAPVLDGVASLTDDAARRVAQFCAQYPGSR
jgi:hypothetical protein